MQTFQGVQDQNKDRVNMAPVSGQKNIFRRAIKIAVSFLIGLLILGALGIYGFDSTNFFCRAVGRIFPYPVLTIGGHFITYRDYVENLMILKRVSAKQDQPMASEVEMSDRVLERLIANHLLQTMAEKRKIKIFDYEIDKEFQKATADLGQGNEVEKNIEQLFGWSAQEYKEQIIKPFILEQKLTTAIFDDEPEAHAKFAKYLQEARATERIIYLIKH